MNPRSLIGVAVALSLAAPLATANPPCHANPWRELSGQAQRRIAPLLSRPLDPNLEDLHDDPSFAAWYHRFYCSAKADIDWSCPGDQPSPEETYAEYRYNSLELPARIATACLAEQFVTEGVWEQLTRPEQQATITYADRRSSLTVKLENPEAFKSLLAGRGYVTDFCGGPKENGKPMSVLCGGPHSIARAKIWGRRSAQDGAALHWYQTGAQSRTRELSVHIDFENPGELGHGLIPSVQAAYRGLHHYIVDKVGWDKRTLSLLLHTESGACGIGPTDSLLAIRFDATDGQSSSQATFAASEGEPGAQCAGPGSSF